MRQEAVAAETLSGTGRRRRLARVVSRDPVLLALLAVGVLESLFFLSGVGDTALRIRVLWLVTVPLGVLFAVFNLRVADSEVPDQYDTLCRPRLARHTFDDARIERQHQEFRLVQTVPPEECALRNNVEAAAPHAHGLRVAAEEPFQFCRSEVHGNEVTVRRAFGEF